jgi:DNA mismatch repair protein MutS2
LNLIEARHPLLPADAVPLSIDVGPNWSVLVITGPNTGGKTVALKTIGLLAAMQQSGIHLPARHGSTLPVFDGIFADIGDQQSIEGSISTFSSHIRALNDIILNSTDESLVLLDELGSSTNPEEGAAIACAVLEQLGDDGITAVATTHHQSVAATAEASGSMSNASFHLDPVTFRPTYKISIGIPGRSYAMEVASRLGLPDSVLQRAERNLSPDYKRVNKWLTEMNRDREELSSILSDTRTYREEAKSIRNRLELELHYLLDKRDEIVEAIRREAETKYQHVKDLLSRAESALSWSRYSNNASGPVENSNLGIEELKADMEGIEIPEPHTLRSIPESIKPGDTVFVRGLGLTGIVHRLDPGDRHAEIRVGTIRMNIETARLSLIGEEDLPDNVPDEKATFVPKSLIARNPETQLDIRGLRSDPAIELVETFLDSSVKDGLSKVRIIHGKGTGALRHAIRQNLKGHPLVNDFGSETDSMGGDGATYVILN